MMLSIVELRVLVVFAVIGVVITLFLLGVVLAELIALIVCVAEEDRARKKKKKEKEKLEAYDESLSQIREEYDALDKENKELRYKIDVLLKDKKW